MEVQMIVTDDLQLLDEDQEEQSRNSVEFQGDCRSRELSRICHEHEAQENERSDSPLVSR